MKTKTETAVNLTMAYSKRLSTFALYIKISTIPEFFLGSILIKLNEEKMKYHFHTLLVWQNKHIPKKKLKCLWNFLLISDTSPRYQINNFRLQHTIKKNFLNVIQA